MTVTIKGYKTKVGVVFVGGCGLNTLRRIIDEHSPEDYPDFLLFGADTDAKVQQKHFGDDQTEEQRARMDLWITSGALIIHQLGEEVTKGRGAGGKPEVGRLAAETEGSVAAITAFLESVDEVFIVCGLGGGTGTGVAPVVAALAVSLKKPTLAITVMPEPKERRTERATTALAEIQSLVPTIAIRNAYLKEMMGEWEPAERARLTYPEAWKIINGHSLVPMLLIIREIVQVTGDINIDQADWETMLSQGNHVFFGLCEVEPANLERIPAEEIVEELCYARFQDSGVIEEGEVILLWAHGPWPVEKLDQVIDLVEARVSAGSKEKKPELFFGIVNKVTDDAMWIALIVVAKEVSAVASVATERPVRPKFVIPPVHVAEEKIVPAEASPIVEPAAAQAAAAIEVRTTEPSAPEARPERSPRRMLRFRSGGTWLELAVDTKLASRFNSAITNTTFRREDYEVLFREVEQATGHLPDLPERLVEVKEEKKTVWGRLASS